MKSAKSFYTVDPNANISRLNISLLCSQETSKIQRAEISCYQILISPTHVLKWCKHLELTTSFVQKQSKVYTWTEFNRFFTEAPRI